MRARTRGTVWACAPAVLVMVFAGFADAQSARDQEGAKRRARLARYLRGEFPDDPPGVQTRLSRPSMTPPPPGDYFLPPFDIVQVNVDALGRNIPGDAANEPSIAVDPTNRNRMAIGWRQFDTISSNFRQAGWAFTQDAGMTWTYNGNIIEEGTFRSDPVLVADADGVFYYNSLSIPGGDFVCQVFRSTNGGMTWGSPVEAFGGDKAWMAIDRTNGPGRGHIYQAWNIFGSCSACGSNTFDRSTDGGASFESPVPVPQMLIFGTLDVAPNGDLYIAGVDPGDFTNFLVSRSTNAENAAMTPTFTTRSVPLNGEMGLGAGPNPGGLLGQAAVAVNPTNGDVYYLCSVDPPGPDPLDIQFSRSTNNGLTWSAPVRVNDDSAGSNAWQWFGTMSVAPNGRIDVVWNDTREAGVDNLSQTFYAFSTDGGVTWSENQPLTRVWNSFLSFPNQDKIGDYYDMVSDNEGADLAFATTMNGEQDVYYVRITP